MQLSTNSRRTPRYASLAGVMLQQEQQATALLSQRMLSVTEVATSLGVNARTIYQWVSRKYILGLRSGPRGHWRIPSSELARLKGAQ
jgi:excisionase family DNA binding protein